MRENPVNFYRRKFTGGSKVHRSHPMRKTLSTILALFARGREIGYAVIEDGELVRYGVKTIKGNRRGAAFKARVKEALAPLLRAMTPEGLIVMEQPLRGNVGGLSTALDHLSRRWKQRGYLLRFLSLPEVSRRRCGRGGATQRGLVEAIVERYPVLWTVFPRVKPEKAKYWERALLAVALAEVAGERKEPSRWST